MDRLDGDRDKTWSEHLDRLRRLPAMGLGGPGDNLLPNSIRAPIKLLMETSAFEGVSEARLTVSPHSYFWRFEGGPLRAEISDQEAWNKCDVLAAIFRQCWYHVQTLQGSWVRPFMSSYNHFFSAVANVLYADTGVLFVGVKQATLWQVYHHGWPVTPPITSPQTTIGFGLACTLNERWFPDLPFTEASVRAEIPARFRSRIHTQWSDKDLAYPFEAGPMSAPYDDVLQWLASSEAREAIRIAERVNLESSPDH